MAMFPIGQIVTTPGALELDTQLPEGTSLMTYLRRHANGDWGDVDAHDQEENNLSVREGFRILSAYETPAGRLWIITEADRSSTTFLLPDEY